MKILKLLDILTRWNSNIVEINYYNQEISIKIKGCVNLQPFAFGSTPHTLNISCDNINFMLSTKGKVCYIQSMKEVIKKIVEIIKENLITSGNSIDYSKNKYITKSRVYSEIRNKEYLPNIIKPFNTMIICNCAIILNDVILDLDGNPLIPKKKTEEI